MGEGNREYLMSIISEEPTVRILVVGKVRERL
jgi:hypothetical protein